MKKIAFTTLGCKANWTDTEDLISECRHLGFEIVPFDEGADAYIVNTCTVTGVADQQSRQMIRRAARKNPNAIVIAIGCGIDIGVRLDGDKVIAFLCERFAVERASADRPHVAEKQSRARAFLKIQDGCDRHCAYCIVPMARGTARSLQPNGIERRCLELAKYHREIVLTGIDIGQYGCDLDGGIDLIALLSRLAAIDEMPRLRISSIDPAMVDARLVDLMASSRKICRHVHLSMQSGCDSVIARMGRRYGADDICRAVISLCDAVPDIAVTGDVIAGFPGERDEDHAQTVDLLASLPLAGLHVFPYSEREGTSAAKMSGAVPPGLRKKRAAELRNIAADKRRKFLAKLVGKQFEVIVTSRSASDTGCVDGFTDNAVSVRLPGGSVSYGEMGGAVISEIEGLNAGGIWDYQRKTKIS